MQRNSILLTLLILTLCGYISAQTYTNAVYNNKVKTVRCYKKGWALSPPTIELNSDSQIEITFDELSGDSKNYYYSIIHCDKNWTESNIPESEFMTGINRLPVNDYDYSFNTTTNYIHYKIDIPNEDIQLHCSGNYIIKVYEDFDDNNPVFIRRFMIYESKVNVFANVKYLMTTSTAKETQEVEFTIDHQNFEISNPLQEVTVHIFQNKRQDNAIKDMKPQFIRDGQLVYNYNREYLFEAGNEFRAVDIRNIKYNGDKVLEYTYQNPFYHAELKPDKPLLNQKYFFNNDFNGDYVIENKEDDDTDLGSEYVLVHFALQRFEPFPDAKIFLMGSFTDWAFTISNELQYNYNSRQYEKTLLLKQGYYNYQYAMKTNHSDEATVYPIENCYAETENEYTIIVYYRNIADRYDRIIGLNQINSVSK